VVTSEAVGGPGFAFPVPVWPMAPDPLVPEVSTPVKLMTVNKEETLCESVALTVTLINGEGANARQISDVPSCTLVLRTSTHVSPAPVTPVTVVLGEETPSVETNASSNSLPVDVEKLGVVTLLAAVP
jgi:hypothetical protein